ncbi:hypothetical protein BHM03_00028161 [Ensete ventricosum]|nr:hypothetical protein BHM03_00028161 [Ensete ventricosum]
MRPRGRLRQLQRQRKQGAGAAEGGSYGYERRWQQLAGDDEEKEIKAAIEEGLAAVKKGLAAAEAVGKTRRQLCVVEEAGKRVAHWCGKGEGTGSGKWLACDEEEESNSGVARGQWHYSCNFFGGGNGGRGGRRAAGDSSRCDRGGRRREAAVATATTRAVAMAVSRGEQGNGRRIRWLATGRWEKSNAARRWQRLAGGNEEEEIKAAIEEGLATVKKGLAAVEAVGKTRGNCVLQRRMGRGQRIGVARERALGPTSGWHVMKRRRAIVVLQEGSGSSGWKSRKKQRRLEERAAVAAGEGFSYDCNFFGGGNEGRGGRRASRR